FILICLCLYNHRSPFFFFSSRRRHTRFSRDWSSDVCSSDLSRSLARSGGGESGTLKSPSCAPAWSSLVQAPSGPVAEPGRRSQRSEERRVGKECRARWSA